MKPWYLSFLSGNFDALQALMFKKWLEPILAPTARRANAGYWQTSTQMGSLLYY
jgi:hypothetical protein